MLDDFYESFSPACFGLLGLWLVVVGLRIKDWQGGGDAAYQRYRQLSYGIALCFVLPGIMSVFALVDDKNPLFWQISFAIVALGGAVTLYFVHHNVPDLERDHVLTYLSAIGLYLVIGLLAIIGILAKKSAGPDLLRADAILLTAVIFLGFNAAWLLLFSPVAAGDMPGLTGAPRTRGVSMPGREPVFGGTHHGRSA